jgi:nucleotide-binding universal stress UspA family protein
MEVHHTAEDTMHISPVVIGVDDSAGARSAVLWAAHEAVLAGAPLLIVHSPRLPSTAMPTGYFEAALRASDDVGRIVLESSIALARANEPAVVVRGLLSHADPAQALIDVSATARLLVLGSRSTVSGDMSMLSSKRLLVSAHSCCPVLMLGPVSSFNPPRTVFRIVVGAADTAAGRAAFAFAAAEAVRRNIELHLLRVENLPEPDALPHDRDRSWRRVEAELSEEIARARREHPGLAIVADLVRGEPAEILPSYSDGRTILVVGCHSSDDRWSTRLGPVATSVVHRNRGPVIVVGNPRNLRPQHELASGHSSTTLNTWAEMKTEVVT